MFQINTGVTETPDYVKYASNKVNTTPLLSPEWQTVLVVLSLMDDSISLYVIIPGTLSTD